MSPESRTGNAREARRGIVGVERGFRTLQVLLELADGAPRTAQGIHAAIKETSGTAKGIRIGGIRAVLIKVKRFGLVMRTRNDCFAPYRYRLSDNGRTRVTYLCAQRARSPSQSDGPLKGAGGDQMRDGWMCVGGYYAFKSGSMLIRRDPPQRTSGAVVRYSVHDLAMSISPASDSMRFPTLEQAMDFVEHLCREPRRHPSG